MRTKLSFKIMIIIVAMLFVNTLPVHIEAESYGEDFNFAAAGDWGCDTRAQETSRNMQAKNPEIILALGDLSYQKSAVCWFQLMTPLLNRTKIVFGDHEYNLKNSSRLEEYMQKFNLDKQYYSFNHGNVHFLAMSSEMPFDKKSEQYKFVLNDLNTASENKSVNWIIVYIYEMLYSSPTFHKPTDTLRDIYHPVFDKYNVNLVLQAHSHNYQRTYPLNYNERNPKEPKIINKNENEYMKKDGTIFAIVGTGGADLQNITGQSAYTAKQFQRFGFLNVEITGNGSKLIGTFYENRDGTDKDHFTIKK